MNDALDGILDESGDEEEQDAIVNQVLDEIGIDLKQTVCISNFNYVLCLYCIKCYMFVQLSKAPAAPSGLATSTAATANTSKKMTDSELDAMLERLKAD